MEAISDFPVRAMPVLPGSGVCKRSWPKRALPEALLGVPSWPGEPVIRWMSAESARNGSWTNARLAI